MQNHERNLANDADHIIRLTNNARDAEQAIIEFTDDYFSAMGGIHKPIELITDRLYNFFCHINPETKDLDYKSFEDHYISELVFSAKETISFLVNVHQKVTTVNHTKDMLQALKTPRPVQ